MFFRNKVLACLAHVSATGPIAVAHILMVLLLLCHMCKPSKMDAAAEGPARKNSKKNKQAYIRYEIVMNDEHD